MWSPERRTAGTGPEAPDSLPELNEKGLAAGKLVTHEVSGAGTSTGFEAHPHRKLGAGQGRRGEKQSHAQKPRKRGFWEMAQDLFAQAPWGVPMTSLSLRGGAS